MSKSTKIDDSRLEVLALSVPQFCKMVGISKFHYYEQLKTSNVPAGFRLGRRRLIPVDDAKQWLRDQIDAVKSAPAS